MITPDDMIRMRRAGFYLREIAEIAGDPWTPAKVQRFLDKLDVKPDEPIVRVIVNRPIKHDYPKWLIEEMYWDCELSQLEIAYELDISYAAVQRIMRRHGISRRSFSTSAQIRIVRHPHSLHPVPREVLVEAGKKGHKTMMERRLQREMNREKSRRRRERERQQVA